MTESWKPTASLDNLRMRAKALRKIRDFFEECGVMEVETPALSQHAVTNPYIESFSATYQRVGLPDQDFYLQTSPEYAMKRLLAAGSGPIYQMAKAFRNGDQSELHNPEFTMLEWYRPNFNSDELMDEIDALLKCILDSKPAERITYQNLFLKFLNFDPFKVSVSELQALATTNGIQLHTNEEFDRDTWLQLLMGHLIEPQLISPIFVIDFPASQAALARLKPENPEVSARFELYIDGMEIANGFHELLDAEEQRKRFEADRSMRAQLGYQDVALDEYLLTALKSGLPDCSGVALGIDRLLMVAAKTKRIAEVISFNWGNA